MVPNGGNQSPPPPLVSPSRNSIPPSQNPNFPSPSLNQPIQPYGAATPPQERVEAIIPAGGEEESTFRARHQKGEPLVPTLTLLSGEAATMRYNLVTKLTTYKYFVLAAEVKIIGVENFPRSVLLMNYGGKDGVSDTPSISILPGHIRSPWYSAKDHHVDEKRYFA
eukprot:1316192-Amorphochlora_amoeboformis.AAC.1